MELPTESRSQLDILGFNSEKLLNSRKDLSIKGGWHLYTLVYSSVDEQKLSCEDARLKIKEALRLIFNRSSNQTNNSFEHPSVRKLRRIQAYNYIPTIA